MKFTNHILKSAHAFENDTRIREIFFCPFSHTRERRQISNTPRVTFQSIQRQLLLLSDGMLCSSVCLSSVLPLPFNIGEKVRVAVQLEQLKVMQEGHGGWNQRMTEVMNVYPHGFQMGYSFCKYIIVANIPESFLGVVVNNWGLNFLSPSF